MNSARVARFLENRESLSRAELDALLAELRASPEAARGVQELLMVDDTLGRAFAPDRAHFVNQVAQRLAAGETADEPGVSEFEQAVLREVRGRAVRRHRAWMAPAFAAAAAVLIGLGIWQMGLVQRPDIPATAAAVLRVESCSPGTTALRQGQSLAVTPGSELAAGDTVRTLPGGSAALAYAGEATRIRLGPATVVRMGGKDGLPIGSGGKAIHLERGSLEGTIAAQAAGLPMVLETPLARATVLGTELRMTSDATRSSLDVEKGSVRFEARASGRAVVVDTGRQGVVRKDELEPKIYGEILLADDFEGGLEKWAVFHETGKGLKPADAEFMKRVRIEKRTDGKPGQWLVMDARGMTQEDEWITLYARKKLPGTAVRMSHESLTTDAAKRSRVDWTVFAEGGETTRVLRHAAGGEINKLMNLDLLWQQRKVAGGWEAYRRSRWSGKPFYEDIQAYKDVDQLEPRVMMSAGGCVVRIDNVMIKTIEPVEIPDLPAVAKP